MGLEKDVKVGNVADLSVSYSAGKVTVGVALNRPEDANGFSLGGQVYASEDAKVFADKLIAAMPAGALKSIATSIEAALLVVGG